MSYTVSPLKQCDFWLYIYIIDWFVRCRSHLVTPQVAQLSSRIHILHLYFIIYMFQRFCHWNRHTIWFCRSALCTRHLLHVRPPSGSSWAFFYIYSPAKSLFFLRNPIYNIYNAAHIKVIIQENYLLPWINILGIYMAKGYTFFTHFAQLETWHSFIILHCGPYMLGWINKTPQLLWWQKMKQSQQKSMTCSKCSKKTRSSNNPLIIIWSVTDESVWNTH